MERAVLFGILAAIAVFVISAGVGAVDPGIGDQDARDAQVAQASWIDSRIALFFSTHFVNMQVTATASLGQQSQSIDILALETDTYPSFIYRIIPVSVLILTGYIFVSKHLNRQSTSIQGAKAGALISAGYVIAVLGGVLLFSHQYRYQGSLIAWNIPLIPAALIAGVIYPIVFGGLGGYLPFRNQGHSRRTSQPARNRERGLGSGGQHAGSDTMDTIGSDDSHISSRAGLEVNEVDQKAVCPECGTEVPANANYCNSCGTSLD